ncbi:C-terminal binding protein [Isosphaeraceae bacterium EP7]
MAGPKRVLITDFLEETTLEAPELSGLADLVLGHATHERDIEELCRDADVIIIFHDIAALTDATFAKAERCKAVIRAGVGYNNVDWKAAGERGILVCNVPDYGTEEVADHAIMLLLATTRKLLHLDASMRAGVWDYKVGQSAPRLRGKTLGLIGCGRIGIATALRAKAFGLDVVFYDPVQPPGMEKALGIRREYDLDSLLAQSQFLSLHCYLDHTSHHIINARTLALLPPGAILLNTARGGLVDQEALIAALESGHLSGAGIDVFEREPLDDDRLRSHPEVILTPHSAFYSGEGFVEMRTKAAQEARRILSGEAPRNLVNREVLRNPRSRI